MREVPWRALHGLEAPLLAALAPVLRGAPAERALDKLLRGPLSREQRAVLAEALFGVALWRRRLARLAGLETHEGAEPRVLLGALLREGGGLGAMGASGGPGRVELRTLAERWSFPDWIAQALEREAGAEAEALAAALCLPGPVFLRANTLRLSREELAARLRDEGVETAPTAHAQDGLRVITQRPNLLGLAAQREGLFEVQDEGSQLLGLLLEARPGETVLDACAGAGGKSLQLACAVGPLGRVICADPDKARLARLRARAQRAGATHLEIAGPAATPGLLCDAVLVDAPCSELGALRRGPDARWRLDPEEASRLPLLQAQILAAAAAHVRPGGRLVYATCTLRREENEEIAEAFTRAQPTFAPAPWPAWLDRSFEHGGFFRALPHRHGTDGFFAARWIRIA